MKTNVAVFFGGRSVEHEISVISASQAMHAMNREKYNVIPVYISKQGRWYTGDALFDLKKYRDMNALTAECREVFMRPEIYKKLDRLTLQGWAYIRQDHYESSGASMGRQRTLTHLTENGIDVSLGYTYKLNDNWSFIGSADFYRNLNHEDTTANMNMKSMNLLGTLETFVQQASFAEFENCVYAADELSLEWINELSLELAEEYGYYDGVNETYHSMSTSCSAAPAPPNSPRRPQ